MRYSFDDYVLDTQRQELQHAGAPVQLQRKVFQVLVYLLAHRERVVPKQELLEQLWPDQFVGDEALKSCMKLLRRALGERGRTPHFVRTLHGQGYRFVGMATVQEHLPAAVTAPPSGSLPSFVRSAIPPVGREAELTSLHAWFVRARTGLRQVVFVTGEAGLGKTTLVETFVAELATHRPLWIGRGQCVEHYGVGEAYLPVLEALGRVCRGPDGQEVVALLRQQAPTWLVQMPSLVRAGDLETLRHRILGATRERMLRELVEALELLTAQQPLVLVLEDLHWSDPSTLDLIAVLARRREPARLLLVGTYRPPEVLRRTHPLHTIKQELQLHEQCVELPLTLLTEDAVATYLASRLPGLPRVDPLVCLVHQRTEGNPLFMVTLLESWLTQKVLIEQDGAWALPAGVEAMHTRVPDSLRHMIDMQLDGHSAEEQQVLEAASVAGVEFSAAAVAAGLAREAEHVDDWCTSLARRGQFLLANEELVWPDGTVAGCYSFAHALYQQVLYQRVSAAQRVRLHQRIGARLEAGYGAQAGDMATELAMHFARGRDTQRAVQYLRQAGQRSMERFAYVEAVAHLTKGLELLQTLPVTPERSQHELTLYIALGTALIATKGYAAPEVEQTYARAWQLCHHLDDPQQRFTVLRGLWNYYNVHAELQTARTLGEQLLTLAQQAQVPAMLLVAHRAIGATLLVLGATASAHTHLAQSIALYDPQQHRAYAFLYGEDNGVVCRSHDSCVLWRLGYPDQGLVRTEEAVSLAQQLAHPFSLGFAWAVGAMFHQLRRERPAVQEHAEAAISLATEQGFPYWKAFGSILQGWTLAHQGRTQEGLAQIQQGLTAWHATGAEVFRPYFLAVLAEAHGIMGQPEAGLTALTEALTLADNTGERWYEPELYRLKGILLLQWSADHHAEAHVCFQQAIAGARQQQAKSLELRAATSLSRLWQQQGKRQEAHDLLAEVYGWFTEGFDTADLQEAQALLEELVG